MCHGTRATALVSFSLLAPGESCCYAVILAFITNVFFCFLNDMAGFCTLWLAMPLCENRKLGAYVSLYKTNCSVFLSCAVPLYLGVFVELHIRK